MPDEHDFEDFYAAVFDRLVGQLGLLKRTVARQLFRLMERQAPTRVTA